MSGAALPIGRRGAGSPALELALFAALAVFGLAQWSRLFDPAPLADLGLALVCACLGAVALTAIGRSGWGRRRLLAAAAAVAFLTVVAAAVAAGLPARLVLPGNWDELVANLSDGLAGIEDTELPYGGADVWLRLTLILAAVVLLTLAAVLAFWPARSRVGPRILALMPLVAIYTIAVTLDAPGAELLWGIPLLLLAAAWLWLPELPGRRWGAVLAIVGGAGVVAVPVAAGVEAERPWFDYESWDWFGGEQSVTYNWNHSYGPLDWPQEGTTLLEAESQQPLYWKTSVLDRFDGFGWQRADESDPLADAEVSARAAEYPSASELAARNPEWRFETDFRVGDLRSGLVVGAGTPLEVEGIDGAVPTDDGTVLAFDDTLTSGDTYSIDTYAPQPSVRRMQRAPQRYPRDRFASTTLVGLPAGSAELTSSGLSPAPAIPMPLWGEPAGPREARILDSPYGPLYGLARRLTASSVTVYDAVRAVESHLQSAYNYTPNVDEETFPLAAFLEQGDGYCQQFSGTMALMLRMVGIPSRVVSGFAPGRLDATRGVYAVRDLDAHSWVEVYFRGIGWVTFDPTPAAAPASAQALEEGGPLRLPRDAAGSTPDGGPVRSLDPELSGGAVPAPSAGESGSPGTVALATLAIIAAAGLLGTTTVVRRRRRLAAGELADSQVREFVSALSRLGWEIPRRVTLFALEQRFAAAGRTAIADYAEALRRHRYGAGHPPPPGPEARRRLREAVSARGGMRRKLRALRAIPPGGPTR